MNGPADSITFFHEFELVHFSLFICMLLHLLFCAIYIRVVWPEYELVLSYEHLLYPRVERTLDHSALPTTAELTQRKVDLQQQAKYKHLATIDLMLEQWLRKHSTEVIRLRAAIEC